jgi:branched-chain amino acid transport system ATP-binding protein
MALSIADRAYVLETGGIALEGKASALLENPKVRAAYLGADAGVEI